MGTLLPFFIVLVVGIIFSEIFKKLNLPWVVALISGGILIGPYVFDIIEPDSTIRLLGDIGLIFLMFMAGLEVKLSSFREMRKDILTLSLFNGLIPLAAGWALGMYLGYGNTTSILLGIIFVSSSIAIVIPSLETVGIAKTKLGKTIISSTIINDILSLLLLSIFLQTTNPITGLPLLVFYMISIITLFVLRWLIPKIRWIFLAKSDKETDLFQQDIRTVFTIIIGTVLSFELLGLHPIIAGFFAGLVLSDSINSEVLIGKLRTLSYGLFIPTFFIVVGLRTDISVFIGANSALVVTLFIVLASVISKLGSGYIAGRIEKYTKRESLLMGASTVPQLSTTLAVVFSARELGLLDSQLSTALVILSIITTVIGPLLVNIFSPKKEELEDHKSLSENLKPIPNN